MTGSDQNPSLQFVLVVVVGGGDVLAIQYCHSKLFNNQEGFLHQDKNFLAALGTITSSRWTAI